MIKDFWNAVESDNEIQIEQILNEYPNIVFENSEHYLGYNVVMYASINRKYHLIEILSQNYVNFIRALNSVDVFNRKISQKCICETLSYLITL
jgi:hypothetical protein